MTPPRSGTRRATESATAASKPHPLDPLLRLADHELRFLLFGLQHPTLARALHSASAELVDKVQRNLVPGRGRPVAEALRLAWAARGTEAAQQQVLDRAEALGRAGRFPWPPPPSRRPKVPPRPPSKRYQKMRAGLEERLAAPLETLSLDEIAGLLVDLSTVAHAETLLVLRPPEGDSESSLLRAGLWIIIDGTEPDLILDVLGTWRDTLLLNHERALDMTIAGLLALQAGDNPTIVRLRMHVYYRDTVEVRGIDENVTVAEIRQQLGETPYARMTLDERAEFMAQLDVVARREGILELKKLLANFGDDFLEMGMKVLLEGEEPQPALEVLETRKETLMARHRTRYRLAIEGLLRIQAEQRTQLLEAWARSLY